jgi:SAM-dependent MidA family methyltransferase
MDWSEKKFSKFFRALHYSLAEQSQILRSRLQTTLTRHLESGRASLVSAVRSMPERLRSNLSTPKPAAKRRENAAQGASPGSTPPDQAPQGQKTIPRALSLEVPLIIFANEFFDALPVEIVSSQGSLRITEGLNETWAPFSDGELEFLDRYGVHPEPCERLEVPLAAQGYASQAAATIPHGFFIAIDYGYTRQEQLAGRHRGTLTTYRQHSASVNPYQAPGEQDITAHVNFTALAATLASNDTAYPLLTQSQFLMGIGEASQFADAFEECRLPQERAKVALQLKHLVTPSGMGEAFHVLVASKGMDRAEVSTLSGLSFGKARRD